MRENYKTNKNTTLSHDVVRIVLGAPHRTALCSYILENQYCNSRWIRLFSISNFFVVCRDKL